MHQFQQVWPGKYIKSTWSCMNQDLIKHLNNLRSCPVLAFSKICSNMVSFTRSVPLFLRMCKVDSGVGVLCSAALPFPPHCSANMGPLHGQRALHCLGGEAEVMPHTSAILTDIWLLPECQHPAETALGPPWQGEAGIGSCESACNFSKDYT